MKFFRNHQGIKFEWNSASEMDWLRIRRNFIAAYIGAYQDKTLDELMFEDELKEKSEKELSNSLHSKEGLSFADLVKSIEVYLIHEYLQVSTNSDPRPLIKEYELLSSSNSDLKTITQAKERITKLLMLKNYFENEFLQEKRKIDLGSKKIDYLIARFHDQPVGFFVCELNPKTARIYLRFVTVSPAFQGLGLGKEILNKIYKRYPEAIGMELYTRKANYSAIEFYTHCKFKSFENFYFEKMSFENLQQINFPEDDITNHPKAFVAFRQSRFG